MIKKADSKPSTTKASKPKSNTSKAQTKLTYKSNKSKSVFSSTSKDAPKSIINKNPRKKEKVKENQEKSQIAKEEKDIDQISKEKKECCCTKDKTKKAEIAKEEEQGHSLPKAKAQSPTGSSLKVAQCGSGSAEGSSVSANGGSSDYELVQAHEEAARDCEALAYKGYQAQGKNDGKDVAEDWQKLADSIRSLAGSATWKELGGNVRGVCSSTGKTAYDPSLKGNISALKSVIVHENVHNIEFKELNRSDENDSYAIQKDYEEKSQQL